MDREGEMEMKEEAEAPPGVEATGAPSRFRRICVFCGSSKGKKTSYQDAAVELGQELVHVTFLIPHRRHFSTLAS